MTGLEFMKEEYLTLRKEVEASVSELATLERQCILSIAAVYAWLVTAGIKVGVVADLAWSIPLIISIFGALRSLSAGQHLQRLSRYIQEIEKEVAEVNTYAKGWEHFHAQASRNKLRTKIRALAWATLTAVTLFIAFHAPNAAARV